MATTSSNPIPTSGPANVFTLSRDTVLHLAPAPDQRMAILCVDEGRWADPDGVPEFGYGRVLSIFDYTATWNWWERHPDGEELVLVLSGSVRLHCDDGDGAPAVVALAAGEGTLVPRGVWHRAEIAEPARMLFVTPAPAQTQHRAA
jgi:quercetin dioxygenase-like cupin family protein